MKQQIANMVLKLDKIGATVALKNVTPAEMRLLCAMHSGNAGGDPVVSFTVIDKEIQDKIKKLEEELAETESRREALGEVDNITEEVRSNRERVLNDKVESLTERIQTLQNIEAIKELEPAQERNRLMGKYNQLLVSKFYPGDQPNMVTKFPSKTENDGKNWAGFVNVTLHAGMYDNFIVGAQALQG